MSTTTPMHPLLDRLKALREESPRARQRDLAAQLGVTEGELVAAHVGHTAVRLSADWGAIFTDMTAVGPVMALTRNEHAVIEKIGTYPAIDVKGHVGLLNDPLIDLRLFFTHWHVGFAVNEDGRRSLQFYDRHGQALHKVHLRETSDVEAFDRLVERHRSADQAPGMTVEPLAAREADRPDAEIDVAKLREEWEALEDTHDFYGLLRRHKVSRTQAFRLVGAPWAVPVAVDSYAKAMEEAVRTGQPVMVFVGNDGIVQIHSGAIHTLKPIEGWFNIMDPDFNLHLKTAGVHTAWIVRKPTVDGIVTSIELYDEAGENIALFFGKRKPGIPEAEGWRAIIAGL